MLSLLNVKQPLKMGIMSQWGTFASEVSKIRILRSFLFPQSHFVTLLILIYCFYLSLLQEVFPQLLRLKAQKKFLPVLMFETRTPIYLYPLPIYYIYIQTHIYIVCVYKISYKNERERNIHCFWTFDSSDDKKRFLALSLCMWMSFG